MKRKTSTNRPKLPIVLSLLIGVIFVASLIWDVFSREDLIGKTNVPIRPICGITLGMNAEDAIIEIAHYFHSDTTMVSNRRSYTENHIAIDTPIIKYGVNFSRLVVGLNHYNQVNHISLSKEGSMHELKRMMHALQLNVYNVYGDKGRRIHYKSRYNRVSYHYDDATGHIEIMEMKVGRYQKHHFIFVDVHDNYN